MPPVAIEAIVLSLIARGPLLLKTASDEPSVARLFLHSLREHAPDLADHVAVMSWPQDRLELNRTACRAAAIVTTYGSDEAVNSLMSLCRFPTRFYGYGHRVSFGVLGPTDERSGELAIDQIAEDVALDAAAYDQRGCMSPHCLFVSQNGSWSPEIVAERLAVHGFPRVAKQLPRGRVDDETAARVFQALGVCEFTARVLPSEQATVVLHSGEPQFHASPGARTLHVVPYDEFDDLVGALRPIAGAISTVGLYCRPEDYFHVTSKMGRLGARRIVRLGRMQRPIWLRDHDGRPRIGDWVDWTDVEPLY